MLGVLGGGEMLVRRAAILLGILGAIWTGITAYFITSSASPLIRSDIWSTLGSVIFWWIALSIGIIAFISALAWLVKSWRHSGAIGKLWRAAVGSGIALTATVAIILFGTLLKNSMARFLVPHNVKLVALNFEEVEELRKDVRELKKKLDNPSGDGRTKAINELQFSTKCSLLDLKAHHPNLKLDKDKSDYSDALRWLEADNVKTKSASELAVCAQTHR